MTRAHAAGGSAILVGAAALLFRAVLLEVAADLGKKIVAIAVKSWKRIRRGK